MYPEGVASETKEELLFEGCGEEGPIRAIFLAEFDPVQGPMMRCQVPEEVVTREIFDEVIHFIIPKQQLSQKTITVTVEGVKILGHPIILEDKKYKRNQFMFNVCFVCYPWSRTVQYEPALLKLSNYLVCLEEEMEFVSNGENTAKMIESFNTIFNELNEKQSSTVHLGDYAVTLKVIHRDTKPPVIHDHDVPVKMVAEGLERGCDLTTGLVN